MYVNKLLQALEDEKNESLINLNSDKIKEMNAHDKLEIIMTYNSTMKTLTELLYTDFKLKIDNIRN
jgi:hypothetical protein